MLNKFITNCTEINRHKWSEFVFDHPNGNIFQTPEMFDVYKKTKNYEPVIVCTADENGNITGILLAVIQSEGRGLIGALSSRAIIWGGPLIKGDNKEILLAILNKYNKVVKKKAIYSQYRNMWDFKEFKTIFHENNYCYEEHLDILNNLQFSEEDLWNKISRDKKKCIRQATNKLIVKEISSNKDNFVESYKLIKNVYNRIKLPIPEISLFTNMFDSFVSKNNVKIFAVYLADKLIGARIVLCYKSLIYDWYAGADAEYLGYRPNDILPWEIMKWGAENGYKTFDFGGAGKPGVPYGVRDHKLKFGGELVNFGRFELIHKPLIMKFSELGFKLYKKLKL